MKKIILLLVFCNSFTSLLAQYSDSLVLGFAIYPLYHKRPEGALGSLLADGIKAMVQKKWNNKVDVAIYHPASIKGCLPKGEITKKEVEKILPYDDSIVILRLNGVELKAVLDMLASMGGAPLAGASFKMKNMEADSIRVYKKMINLQDSYIVATNYYFFVKRIEKIIQNTVYTVVLPSVRNLLCEYMLYLSKIGKPIAPIYYKRISY